MIVSSLLIKKECPVEFLKFITLKVVTNLSVTFRILLTLAIIGVAGQRNFARTNLKILNYAVTKTPKRDKY